MAGIFPLSQVAGHAFARSRSKAHKHGVYRQSPQSCCTHSKRINAAMMKTNPGQPTGEGRVIMKLAHMRHCTGQTYEVRVLAVSGSWAMVRRKGAMPFVANVKELIPITAPVPGSEPSQAPER